MTGPGGQDDHRRAAALRFACIVLAGEVPVMTGPGDEMAAGTAGRGRLRASHAEREQAIEVLKAAFVQGRLTKDEFDARAGQALMARTCAELAALTADIPAVPAASRPLGQAARTNAQPPANRSVRKGVGIAAALLAVLLIAHGATLVIVVLIVTVARMLKSRRNRHSGGQLPPLTPGAGGKTSQRPASAASAEQLPPIDQGHQHTAEAARSDRAYPQSSSSPPPHRWRHRGRRFAIGYVGH